MTDHSFEFTHAITRCPARSVVDGLRAEDHGIPEFDQMLKDHAHYVATLRETGAEIIELLALNEFPDAVFAEDNAISLKNSAILYSSLKKIQE